MAGRKRGNGGVTKESLRQLALAHNQTIQARDDQAKRDGTTDIVMEMFGKQIRDLEVKAMQDLKAWLGLDRSEV